MLNLTVNIEKMFILGFSIQECTQVGDSGMNFFSILFVILIFHVCLLGNGWKKEKKRFSVEVYLLCAIA